MQISKEINPVTKNLTKQCLAIRWDKTWFEKIQTIVSKTNQQQAKKLQDLLQDPKHLPPNVATIIRAFFNNGHYSGMLHTKLNKCTIETDSPTQINQIKHFITSHPNSDEIKWVRLRAHTNTLKIFITPKATPLHWPTHLSLDNNPPYTILHKPAQFSPKRNEWWTTAIHKAKLIRAHYTAITQYANCILSGNLPPIETINELYTSSAILAATLATQKGIQSAIQELPPIGVWLCVARNKQIPTKFKQLLEKEIAQWLPKFKLTNKEINRLIIATEKEKTPDPKSIEKWQKKGDELNRQWATICSKNPSMAKKVYDLLISDATQIFNAKTRH